MYINISHHSISPNNVLARWYLKWLVLWSKLYIFLLWGKTYNANINLLMQINILQMPDGSFVNDFVWIIK